MPTPTTPHIVKITGAGSAVAGDTVRILVTSSDGATNRGTTTTVLDSNSKAQVDLANFASDYVDGDLIVVSEIGGALISANTTISGGGTSITLTGVTLAFPSRTL